ncbi:hypothetical protein GKQ77_00530 [Streptomyces sp. BG9H]|uniref:Uncharacterized protein n=1 Tax=Streptomyces anatolicus TaxID=2675858 RepID=A0ABS6YF80_9ACTN|nr:hypothetical protein [Streptomyces anatolicus]MBW5420070.1 hypothetical protein [Streptomyces anatolicus]
MPEVISIQQQSAQSQLAAGERLLAHGIVVPVKSAEGVKLKHGRIGGMVGDHLMHRYGAQSGGAQSIAAAMPSTSGDALLLRVTDQRVGLVQIKDGTPVWEVPRTWVTQVERRPRLQLMARFRVHYADGSWLAFLTARRRTIEAFITAVSPPTSF